MTFEKCFENKLHQANKQGYNKKLNPVHLNKGNAVRTVQPKQREQMQRAQLKQKEQQK